jgi:DNA-binding transcriptional regulator YdaS (Cro superfamily)
MNNKIFKKLIAFFGNQEKAAKELSITQATVSRWQKNNIPIKWAIECEKLTKGAITRQELRPDIFN